MLFYEMEFVSKNNLEKSTKDEQFAMNNKIKRDMCYLNGKIAENIVFAISQIVKDRIVLCAGVKDGNKDNCRDKACECIRKLEIDAKLTECNEITMTRFFSLIDLSSRNDFISNEQEILDNSEISDLRGYDSDHRLKEEIVKNTPTKEESMLSAEKLLYVPEILPEIERIYTETKQKTFYAHPVQYVVMATDDEIKKEIRNLLVGSLFQAGRLPSKRICFVGTNTDRFSHESIDDEVAEELYNAQHGTTMIYQPIKSGIVGGVRNKNYECLQKICKLIQKYHADTLNIIELERGDEKTLELIQEELPDIKFVVFRENMIFTQEAKKYLKARAKQDKITNTKSLLKMLPEKNEGFYPSDLSNIYSKWFDARVCSEVYPQYLQLGSVSAVLKKKPKGDAYQQLDHLIGLEQAKKVIKGAIDYHNAQKIFTENGIHTENVARHMVFTGNPGSAKTTVARLFAQIMKDNKLLENGELIECGRADIVDMYLGGTAPRVRRLFKKAEGNVLFIDEAYSLVDGDRGLYGDEAINAIVQEMENHRDDTVVIFAGYPDKMEKFLDANPGLRSRIAFHVPFDDYSPAELSDILDLFVSENDLVLDNDVKDKVLPIFEEAVKHPDFGNGRFVRNMFEKARMKQASRVVSLKSSEISKDVLSVLKADDFEIPAEYSSKNSYRQIGFAS